MMFCFSFCLFPLFVLRPAARYYRPVRLFDLGYQYSCEAGAKKRKGQGTGGKGDETVGRGKERRRKGKGCG